MMTPQDLKEKKFERTLLNGYDMAPVDDFLEQIYEDFGALYKENAVLKSKIKVLVEKVEEYRSTEDSMRMALLTAQKMGGELLDESRAKGDAILAEVNEQAKRRAIELREQLAGEEARLAAAEQRTSEFSKKVLRLIADEADFIERLGELVIPDQAPASAPAPAHPAAPVVVSEHAPAPHRSEAAPADEMQAAIEASLAEEVSRMTEEFMGETKSEPPVAEPHIPAEPVEPERPAKTVKPVKTVKPAEPGESVFNITLPTDLQEKLEAQRRTTPPSNNLFDMFDQDRIEEAFQQNRIQDVQEAAPAPATQSPAAPVIDAKEAERIDIARDISASLGDTEEFKVDADNLWDDEGAPTTKRPKFEFDDLQFGSNFGDENNN